MRRYGPLDYTYLKALTPMAQRFYELLSYKMFAALKYRHPHATLRYASIVCCPRSSATPRLFRCRNRCTRSINRICDPATSPRSSTSQPPTPTASPTGCCTTPRVPKPVPSIPPSCVSPAPRPRRLLPRRWTPTRRTSEARSPRSPLVRHRPHDARRRASHARVTGGRPSRYARPDAQHRRPTVPARQASGGALPCPASRRAPDPGGRPCPAVLSALPWAHRGHPVTQRTGTRHRAPGAPWRGQSPLSPRVCPPGGSRDALRAADLRRHPALPPRALAAYDAQATRATQAATQRAAADERTQREQYQAWEQRQLAQLRTALLPEELAALEAEAHARLVAAGTPAVALPLAVRVAVDQVLAAQAGLPSFEAWQQTQEVG